MRLLSKFKFKMLIRHINDFQIATAPCQKYMNSTTLRTEKCHSTNDLKIGNTENTTSAVFSKCTSWSTMM